MQLTLSESSLRAVGDALAGARAELAGVLGACQISGTTGAYSAVPGLRAAAVAHGMVMSGPQGSAVAAVRWLMESLEWLAAATRSTWEAVDEQDALAAWALDRVDREEGGDAVVGAAASFPARPPEGFPDFPFPVPAAAALPSLDALAMAFAATRGGEVGRAVATWGKVASVAERVAGELARAVEEVAADNRGAAADAAQRAIAEVGNTARVFADHSAALVASVGALEAARVSGAGWVAAMLAAVKAIGEPAQRKAAEATFLAVFPAAFQPFLAAAVPPFRNLLVPGVSGVIGGARGKGGPAPAGERGIPEGPVGARDRVDHTAHDVEGEAMLRGVIDAAEEVARGGCAVFDEAWSAIKGARGQVVAAGVVGVAPAAAMPDPVVGGHVAPARLEAVGGGVGGASGAVGLAGAGTAAGIVGAAPIDRGARLPGVAPMSRGMRTVSAVGVTPSGGLAGPGGRGAGMVPMASSPGALARAKKKEARAGKVRTVTSAVEESPNIEALLGPRKPVVPGVIGDWARG